MVRHECAEGAGLLGVRGACESPVSHRAHAFFLNGECTVLPLLLSSQLWAPSRQTTSCRCCEATGRTSSRSCGRAAKSRSTCTSGRPRARSSTPTALRRSRTPTSLRRRPSDGACTERNDALYLASPADLALAVRDPEAAQRPCMPFWSKATSAHERVGMGRRRELLYNEKHTQTASPGLRRARTRRQQRA